VAALEIADLGEGFVGLAHLVAGDGMPEGDESVVGFLADPAAVGVEKVQDLAVLALLVQHLDHQHDRLLGLRGVAHPRGGQLEARFEVLLGHGVQAVLPGRPGDRQEFRHRIGRAARRRVGGRSARERQAERQRRHGDQTRSPSSVGGGWPQTPWRNIGHNSVLSRLV
jgi:hypothetical protein